MTKEEVQQLYIDHQRANVKKKTTVSVNQGGKNVNVTKETDINQP
jgi:hypothetical protein